MNKVFLKKNPMDISDYIASEIRDYQEFRADTEENPIDDPALIVDYLTLIVYYLVKCRPRSDHDIDSICKLMGASYFEEGRRTPFWAIISEVSSLRKGALPFFCREAERGRSLPASLPRSPASRPARSQNGCVLNDGQALQF